MGKLAAVRRTPRGRERVFADLGDEEVREAPEEADLFSELADDCISDADPGQARSTFDGGQSSFDRPSFNRGTFNRVSFNRVSFNRQTLLDRASFERVSFKRVSNNVLSGSGARKSPDLDRPSCPSFSGLAMSHLETSILEVEAEVISMMHEQPIEPIAEVALVRPVVAGGVSLYRSLNAYGGLPDAKAMEDQLISELNGCDDTASALTSRRHVGPQVAVPLIGAGSSSSSSSLNLAPPPAFAARGADFPVASGTAPVIVAPGSSESLLGYPVGMGAFAQSNARAASEVVPLCASLSPKSAAMLAPLLTSGAEPLSLGMPSSPSSAAPSSPARSTAPTSPASGSVPPSLPPAGTPRPPAGRPSGRPQMQRPSRS